MNFDRVLSLLMLACEALITLMIYQDFRKDRGRPELQMPKKKWAFMIVIGLLPIAALVYDRAFPAEIPEFDAVQEQPTVTSYGADSPDSCFMTVYGDALRSRKDNYKLAVGCFVYDGQQDVLDSPYLQVSSLYDITPGELYLKASFSPEFAKYFKEKHAIGIDIVLLNVPNGIQTSQFTTLRQARALGVRLPAFTVYKGYRIQGPSQQTLP
jgi:hypothetical protein